MLNVVYQERQRALDAEKEQDIRREGSHTDAVVHTREEVAYLERTVSANELTASTMLNRLARFEEDINGADSMWEHLQEENSRLEAKLGESNAYITTLQKQITRVTGDLLSLESLSDSDNAVADIKKRLDAIEVSKRSVDYALSGDVAFGDLHGITVSAAALNAAAAGTFKRTITCHLKTTTLPVNLYHDWAQLAVPAPTPTKGTAWAPTTLYKVGNFKTNDTGPVKIYRCIVAGTSAGSGGPTGTGTGITDGTVTWDFAGNVVADAGIAAPTIEGTPAIVDGVLETVLVFWTDGGLTTHVSGELMVLEDVKVAADDLLPTSVLVPSHSVSISIVD